jgi:hypothetical protein
VAPTPARRLVGSRHGKGKDNLRQILLKGIPVEVVTHNCGRLSSEQALQYGLAHEIRRDLYEKGASVLELA